MAYSKHFYTMIQFTLLTTKLFLKVHSLKSIYFIDLQPQLYQVSQSGLGSQFTINCQTCVIC